MEETPKSQNVEKAEEEKLKNIFAQGAMTPEQAELSLQREEGYGKLNEEQLAIVNECRLNVKQQSALGGMIQGFHRVISGTIEDGKKVKIIFDPAASWEGFAEATVDGKEVSRDEALMLRDKYKAIAEFQTKENVGVGEYKYNELIKRNKERLNPEKSGDKDDEVSTIRERIKRFFT